MALLINKEGIPLNEDSSVNEIYLRIKYTSDLSGRKIRCMYYPYLSKEKFTEKENFNDNKILVPDIPYEGEFTYDSSIDGGDVLDFVHQKTTELLTSGIFVEMPKRDPSIGNPANPEGGLVIDPSTGEVVMESIQMKPPFFDVSEISIVDLD